MWLFQFTIPNWIIFVLLVKNLQSKLKNLKAVSKSPVRKNLDDTCKFGVFDYDADGVIFGMDFILLLIKAHPKNETETKTKTETETETIGNKHSTDIRLVNIRLDYTATECCSHLSIFAIIKKFCGYL